MLLWLWARVLAGVLGQEDVQYPVLNVQRSNPQHALKDKGVINSGCSRHMIGNMSYLSDFEELNGGYFAFEGNPKGGKISGKGKIRTCKLDCDDVYFVKELKFNLFSFSQMSDKKNSVLFTDIECLVLSPDFKLPDASQEGFLVGYSISSKAFRVFNSRTRIVQETLHVNFLENKPNVAGSGPTWLFDNDSIIKTMNYQPVNAGNQPNPSAGFQDKFVAEKAWEEIDQQYVLFPVCSAQSRKQDDKNKREAKGKSYVESFTGYRDLNEEFEDYSNNSINKDNAAGSIVPTVGQISPNSTNTFSDVSPSNAAASPTHEKSSLDASQLPDDPDMP
nr:ribonuclease H-like domain-containing protein [Tanacetum cinerariifolium]